MEVLSKRYESAHSSIKLYWKQLSIETSSMELVILILSVSLWGTILTTGISSNMNPVVFVALPILLISYYLFPFQKDINSLKINRIDICFITLLLWMILSYSWATDPSKTLYIFFGYLCSYIYLLTMRYIDIGNYTQNIISVVLSTILVIILTYALYISYHKIDFNNSFFQIHRNKVAINILGIYPFLLFSPANKRWHIFIKVLLTLAVFQILLYTNCRGGMMAFFSILSLFFIARYGLPSRRKLLFTGVSLLFLCIILLLIPYSRDILIEHRMFQEFYDLNELDRWYMMRNSFWLFLENPIGGVGLGNWRIEAYKTGYEDFAYSTIRDNFKTLEIHNLYAQFLSELGIVGFVTFILAFFTPLIKSLRGFRNLNNFQLACCGSLLTFLISCFFYASSFLTLGSNSPLFILAVFSLAHLIKTSNSQKISSLSRKSMALISTPLLLCCVFYFVFDIYVEGKIKLYKEDRKNSEVYIDKMKSIYYPGLKTNFNYYNIAQLIGYDSRRTENNEQTEKYYEEAISQTPYNVTLLSEYAHCQVSRLKNFEKAEIYAERAHKIFPDHFETNLLLAQIKFGKSELIEARKHLSFVEEEGNRLELFKTKYAKDLTAEEVATKIAETPALRIFREGKELLDQIDVKLTSSKLH